MAWLDKDVSLGLLEPSSKVVAEHLMKAKAGATFRRSITRNTGKHERRLDDESVKPLASYRAEELERMWVNFFGPDPAYHEARRRFVFKGNPPPPRSQLPVEAEAEEASWVLSQGATPAGMGVLSVF